MGNQITPALARAKATQHTKQEIEVPEQRDGAM